MYGMSAKHANYVNDIDTLTTVEELERRLLARQQELKEIRDSRRALEEEVDAGKQELQELEIKLAKWKKDTSAERKANMTFIHESLLISELGGPLVRSTLAHTRL